MQSEYGRGTGRAAFLGLALALAVPGAPATAASVVSAGVLAFQDDSGAGAPPELGGRIARDFQQKLNQAHQDVLARMLPPTEATGVEDLQALGRQGGMAFVVRGGLLSASTQSAGEETRLSVQVYADVVAVESGKQTTLRASAEVSRPGSIEPFAVDPQSAEFAASPLGEALGQALAQLATAAHDAMVAPAVADVPAAVPSGEGAVASAGLDEELQQLMGQASFLISGGGGAVSSSTLQTVSSALDGLKGALAQKASQLQQGQDTSAADQQIVTWQQQLQTAVAAATEQAATATSVDYSGEKKSLLASLGDSLGEASAALRQVQELKAAWRDVHGGEPGAEYGAPEGSEGAPAEEPVGEVSGVVSESGEPVEGATVTDPESGATATTDENGSYTLTGVVPGRLTTLVVAQKGKQLAVSKVDVLRGRLALADFNVKPKGGTAATPVVGVIPSIVVLHPSKSAKNATGRVSGVVKDAQGKVQARTLVSLEGLGQARTDSQGRYSFVHVPPGPRKLTIYYAGAKAETRVVQVAAQGVSTSNVQVAQVAKPPGKLTGPPLVLKGSGTALKGTVKGSDGKPVAGARVTALLGGRAVVTTTDAQGRYLLKDVKPGTYKLVVDRLGYDTANASLEARAGKQESRDFKLQARPTALSTMIGKQVKVVATPTPRPSGKPGTVATPKPGTQPTPKPTSSPRVLVPVKPAPGSLRGSVADAKTGKPLSGVAIYVAGRGAGSTSSAGSFAVNSLDPGTYDVVARRSGYLDGSARVTVRSGQTASVSLKLTPQQVLVKPRVR